jgi:predicted nucleotidyltransferase
MAKNLHREYSYKELKALSKFTSDNGFQIAINKFKEENLVTGRRIGTSLLLKANLSNELLYSYITIINSSKLPKNAFDTIQRLKQEIEKYTLTYSIVVFGSYADNTQTKQSDLDIAIFLPDKKKEHEVKIAVNSIKKRLLIELDCHIITYEEFLKMLKADYTNLGKLIAAKNLPLVNIGIFYKLLTKGVENGFAY